MGRLRRVVAWLLLAFATLVAVALWLHQRQRPTLPVIATLPQFELTERDGSHVALADLAGAPWIADFVFTRCRIYCPRLTERMRELRARLPEPGRVRSVSFSVDPGYDTPAVLTRYAAEHRIEGRDWLLLTDGPDSTRRLVREGFLLPVDDQPEVAAMPVLHSTRFALVDSAGRVRFTVEAFEDDALERLLAALAELEREERRGR
jgi:protein SCO1/2